MSFTLAFTKKHAFYFNVHENVIEVYQFKNFTYLLHLVLYK